MPIFKMKKNTILMLVIIILVLLTSCSIAKEQSCNIPDERACKQQSFFLFPLCQPEYNNQSEFIKCNPR